MKVIEEYILIKPTMEYAEQIVDYRKEFLEVGDSMDGTGSLRRIDEPSEYIKFCEACENPATVPENLEVATQFLFIRVSNNKLVGMIQVRHYFNDFLEKFDGHIGYSIRPDERRKGMMVLKYMRNFNLLAKSIFLTKRQAVPSKTQGC